MTKQRSVIEQDVYDFVKIRTQQRRSIPKHQTTADELGLTITKVENVMKRLKKSGDIDDLRTKYCNKYQKPTHANSDVKKRDCLMCQTKFEKRMGRGKGL